MCRLCCIGALHLISWQLDGFALLVTVPRSTYQALSSSAVHVLKFAHVCEVHMLVKLKYAPAHLFLHCAVSLHHVQGLHTSSKGYQLYRTP
jgi:hypothetical protein